MREARTRVGLIPEGEILLTYRAPHVPGFPREEDISFGKWGSEDPLPSYNDHVTGYTLASPPDETASTTPERPEDWPSYRPSHPSFGPPSVVAVPRPWEKTTAVFRVASFGRANKRRPTIMGRINLDLNDQDARRDHNHPRRLLESNLSDSRRGDLSKNGGSMNLLRGRKEV